MSLFDKVTKLIMKYDLQNKIKIEKNGSGNWCEILNDSMINNLRLDLSLEFPEANEYPVIDENGLALKIMHQMFEYVGDIDANDVTGKASSLTPVPGGVGPMTITMLLYNTIKSAKKIALTV